MDAAEECERLKLLQLYLQKNREMLRKRPLCKINPAYILLVFSVHISYT